ncbi:MAG: mRNA interferase YafQ [Campylobacterota bacterium]|nr:mRNA interferase YafQ [Campylobacterota bacterium]
MSYTLFRTSAFKKSFKKLSTSDQQKAFDVIEKLALGKILAPKYKNHFLAGDFLGCQECHIKPDLLLIYRIYDDILELALVDVGSHSKLFG